MTLNAQPLGEGRGSVGKDASKPSGRLWQAAVASFLMSLAACGGSSAPEQPAGRTAEEAASTPVAAADDRIACAIGGATAFAPVCGIERSEPDQGRIVTLRHPDGGFRRLLVVQDGRGVVAADGAEPASVVMTDQDKIEVTIGKDRYRLPAIAKAPAR